MLFRWSQTVMHVQSVVACFERKAVMSYILLTADKEPTSDALPHWHTNSEPPAGAESGS